MSARSYKEQTERNGGDELFAFPSWFSGASGAGFRMASQQLLPRQQTAAAAAAAGAAPAPSVEGRGPRACTLTQID